MQSSASLGEQAATELGTKRKRPLADEQITSSDTLTPDKASAEGPSSQLVNLESQVFTAIGNPFLQWDIDQHMKGDHCSSVYNLYSLSGVATYANTLFA